MAQKSLRLNLECASHKLWCSRSFKQTSSFRSNLLRRKEGLGVLAIQVHTKSMTQISKFLDPHLTIFLNANNRDESLHSMVEVLHQNGKIKNPQAFYQAIIDREKVVSTGIGMGVAI